MANKNRNWRDIHCLLSVFFLPVALVYAITGGMYLMGPKGESRGHRPAVGIEAKAPANANSSSAVSNTHEANPNMMEQGKAPNGGYGERKPSGLFGKLMMLHKGKGGKAFNIVGIAFAVSMLIMYISGIVVGWSIPSMRRRIFITFASGLVVTIIAVIISL